MRFHNPLRNPHYKIGGLICKMSVNYATALWSLVVLCNQDAISRAAYAKVAMYVHEDIIASVLMSISIAHTVCLSAQWRPFRMSSMGYLLMLVWWTIVLVLILLAPGPLPPTALMGVSLLTVLAAYAFISGPRRGGDVLGA